jgi:ribosomal protein S12 methylthiotransferase
MNPRKINIITLGCSKNVVDSEKLMRQLDAGGYSVVFDQADKTAGTVIINTCGFINDAKEESIDTILRYVREKEYGNIKNLYVIGCLSERYSDALKNEIPEVTRYFGVNNLTDIVNELNISTRKDLLTDRMLTGPGHYAYLKISEGCNRKCSFCAIPSIRGKYISRSQEEIEEEACRLFSGGVKELILIAQDLSYYGLDLYGKQSLPDLVSNIMKKQQFDWIRLHYLYPANFPSELLDLIIDNPQICRYIDIPIQHISDNMLRSMKRSHNRRDTVKLLETIRKKLPDAAIRTTLITGYPGETKEDFNSLKDFIKDFMFDRLGVFAYSHEEDTYAYKQYKDNIPEEVKLERVSELMTIQQGISEKLNSRHAGKVLKVIIDREEGEFSIGRTEYDSPEVDQEVLVPSEHKLIPGNFYNIKITATTEFDLYGVPHIHSHTL